MPNRKKITPRGDGNVDYEKWCLEIEKSEKNNPERGRKRFWGLFSGSFRVISEKNNPERGRKPMLRLRKRTLIPNRKKITPRGDGNKNNPITRAELCNIIGKK